ncbi:MAG: glycosyltransferase family 2 protein [Actinomycetaceae bacterium]|nr:glycosyltransferase family 2 protein [Actinomycetaceae bacterium]
MSGESVRVVTVAFNPGEELALFAESLGQATQSGTELVIVDNGTEHDLVDAVGRAYGAKVLRPGVNLGYGAAVNLGAVSPGFDGRWLLVANPDVVFLPGSLDGLLAAAAAWPNAGAFGPLIRDGRGEVYPSARRFPRLVSGSGHALLSGVWPSNPFSRAYREHADTTRAHTVDWLSGACILLRWEAFAGVGGFDESYFMFFEDTQLGEQLAGAGWECVYVPDAEVVHEQGVSWRDKPEDMLRAHHRSAAHYLDGVYSRPGQAPLRLALHAGLKVREEVQVRLARK